jgi:hypothetical protein
MIVECEGLEWIRLVVTCSYEYGYELSGSMKAGNISSMCFFE